MTNTNGRSLELFFIDGKPDGMLTAEVFNWTGHVLVAPRTRIADALKRPESSFTGVYLLIGEKDDSPLAYIGEGENISYRLRNHDAGKDWWNTAVLITSTANNLNKAHVRYLESRLIQEALDIGKAQLENAATPALPGLTEAARANMEAFLEYVLMILPAVRVDFLLRQTRPRSVADPTDEAQAVFELTTPRHGLHAVAILQDGDFVVQEGSIARSEWVGQGSSHTSYGQLFVELVRTGVLQEHGGHRVFATNYAFKSPSAAAAVVTGRPSNGRTEWKERGSGQTVR